MLLPALAWSGGAWAEFRFRCLDDGAWRPVTNASLRVVQIYDLRSLTEEQVRARPEVKTDEQGRAVVKVMCGAGGGMGLFGKTGNFIISHELWADAPGHRPIRAHLANVVGGRRWPLKHRTFEVELFLIKLPPEPQP
jgi:hypothetical protein